jgi:predicted amidohydrolase YtcJ
MPGYGIRATGGHLIPGLWDMHVHITDATELALPILLANGITGVRDAGGDFGLLRRLEHFRQSCPPASGFFG